MTGADDAHTATSPSLTSRSSTRRGSAPPTSTSASSRSVRLLSLSLTNLPSPVACSRLRAASRALAEGHGRYPEGALRRQRRGPPRQRQEPNRQGQAAYVLSLSSLLAVKLICASQSLSSPPSTRTLRTASARPSGTRPSSLSRSRRLTRPSASSTTSASECFDLRCSYCCEQGCGGTVSLDLEWMYNECITMECTIHHLQSCMPCAEDYRGDFVNFPPSTRRTGSDEMNCCRREGVW